MTLEEQRIQDIWANGRRAEQEELRRRKEEIEAAWREGRRAEYLKRQPPEKKGCRFWPFGG